VVSPRNTSAVLEQLRARDEEKKRRRRFSASAVPSWKKCLQRWHAMAKAESNRRAKFIAGRSTYSANFGAEFESIKFWDALRLHRIDEY